ncbi:hypothetical protein PNEG_00003 [Pneumocystis murina B123]|uniref:Endoplasmic reticulum-Golgi intermediate compartment protein n=1 Tax=Pneumocystis murina (strain B123) TaxID=1069680 RepID=M7NS25_PNEMU|nr:hypothetical protein PNEG_00003 [Pneumocystis murina B123]EMR11558.1 hypothetical protein PNEG_00003 [Pneumocystis murina B123]
MSQRTGFRRFDAFSKTIEDAQIKTINGGFITILSIIVIFVLISFEWHDYRQIVILPELTIDRSRGEKLQINLNLTFPKIPCSILSLDVMDVSGELQTDVSHNVVKNRLDSNGVFINSTSLNTLNFQQPTKIYPPDYCGSCYGAKEGCCNTCQDVIDAYTSNDWPIPDTKAFEQCKENYNNLNDSDEGCNFVGRIEVNKVIGNFHFAPGHSSQIMRNHIHDIYDYMTDSLPHDFSHTINKLSFGPEIEGRSLQNPLDNVKKETNNPTLKYSYFIKCVAYRFEYLSKPSLDTNKYSVTVHERSVSGDSDPNHPTHVSPKDGIPGVFFSYDISPIKIIEKETRGNFSTFLTSTVIIISGVLTIAGIVDRILYETERQMEKKLREGKFL